MNKLSNVKKLSFMQRQRMKELLLQAGVVVRTSQEESLCKDFGNDDTRKQWSDWLNEET